MWNDLVERNQESITKPTIVASSEALGNNLGAKRQRRPSVRLGEIGDQPAAIIPELYLKRKKQSAAYAPFQMNNASLGDDSINIAGNDTIETNAGLTKAAKLTRTRPLVHVNNGNFHEQNSSDEVICKHADHVSSHSLIPAENQSEFLSASQVGDGGRQLQQFVKMINKKGRNVKRRPGGPRSLAPVERITKSVPTVIQVDGNEKEKVSGIEDTADPHSDEEYDAGTPEGFRDCDLEASEYYKNGKASGNSQAVGSQDADVLIRAPLEFEQQYESPQVSGERTFEQEQEPIERSADRGGSASKRIGMLGNTSEASSDAEMKPLTEATANTLHERKAKLTLEANGNLESREPAIENVEQPLERAQPLVRLCFSLLNGVKGWLHDLGLGKYAQLFETHEVDTEVLPLLTLDDLKEMGINAVGTRRKMFYAIQKLGKGLMGRADSF